MKTSMRSNKQRRRDLRQLWNQAQASLADFEEAFDAAQARLSDGTIRLDDSLLVRPTDRAAEQLLAALGLDSPKRFLDLYGQELRAVPVVGKVRPNRLPGIGAVVNKRNMTALLAGFAPDVQREVLLGMRRVEGAYWTSPAVTAYLAERRSGGLKEIPPALLARRRAVDLAIDYLLASVPKTETTRLAGLGVGSGDELVQIGQGLLARGRDVEIKALELNADLVCEANRALQTAQIRGEVLCGSMNDPSVLGQLLAFRPHLIIDHWAGCYDSLPIQKARFGLIREQLPDTAYLFCLITDEWGVGRMIAGERKRNAETVQELVGRTDPVDGGIVQVDGRVLYAYPSQLQLMRRLKEGGSPLASRRAAAHGFLSTLLPREIRLGPWTLVLADGQDALRVSAPYGAALQVWSCRYPLRILQEATASAGWALRLKAETLFGAGAAMLLC
jgi:hypothetical protein